LTAVPPTQSQWWWAIGLAIAVLAHMVPALRAEERRRDWNLHAPHIDMTSVWTFAGALVLPPVLSFGLVLLVRLLIAGIRRRHVHRVIYGTASILIAVAAAHALCELPVSAPTPVSLGGLPGLAAFLMAAATYWVLPAVLIGTIMHMTETPTPPWRSVLGSFDDNATEVATILAGCVLALADRWWTSVLAAGPVLLANLKADRTQQRLASTGELLREQALLLAEQSNQNAQLAYDAETDPLTGLLNRRGWLPAIEEIDRSGRAYGVFMMDLDYFKQVNDNYGHPAGNALLRSTAARLRHELNDADPHVIGRYGGEEFIVVVETELNSATMLAERLRVSISNIRLVTHNNAGEEVTLAGRRNLTPGRTPDGTVVLSDSGGTRIPIHDRRTSADRVVSVSIGVVHSDGWPRGNVDRMIACADEALRAAKQHRNTVVVEPASTTTCDGAITRRPQPAAR
jgi:diguanylate cyclase (GGDEF)-like protein